MKLDWLTQTLAAGLPVPLEALELPYGASVVMLGPHPDDFDAIAVTLRRLASRGHPLTLAVLTSGWSGVEDAFCSPPTVEEKRRIREAEQRASCRLFGLPDENLEFLCLAEDQTGEIVENLQAEQRMAECLDRRRPQLVFLPHGQDTNPTHRTAFAMTRRILATRSEPTVVFLNRDPKTTTIRTDVYTAFGQRESLWKAGLLRAHLSQQVRNLRARGRGFDERILAVDRDSGARLGLPGATPFAETFEIAWFPG